MFGGTLHAQDCAITGNTARDGGGMSKSGISTVTVTTSTISGNSATRDGGGIYMFGGTLHAQDCAITGNTARDGAAIYWSSYSIVDSDNYVAISNTTFMNNTLVNGGFRTIFNAAKIFWECQLGYFQQQTGHFGDSEATADFDTCSLNPCPAGFLCTLPNLTQYTAEQLCPPGHYCDQEATTRAAPCPAGTSFPGKGSNVPNLCSPCIPGQYQPAEGSTQCSVCDAGTYSAGHSQACTPCPLGGYCSSAGMGSVALAFKPCPAGRFNAITGSSTEADCILCAVGMFSTKSGADSNETCSACRPGSIAPYTGSPECGLCDPGFYQDNMGAIKCKPCEPGSYCPRGASAPLPCKQGSFSSATNLESAAQCTSTNAGFSAATGSVAPTACAPGTIAAAGGQAVCQRCSGGTFQRREGATACEPCDTGSYCPPGASAPLPCEEGTYSIATNLARANECTPTDAGFFCGDGQL